MANQYTGTNNTNGKIQSDFLGFFAGGAGYDPMSWGGGTIQLNKDGTATHTTANGEKVSIDKNTNMFKLADQYSGIEKQYADTYGTDWRAQAPSTLGWTSSSNTSGTSGAAQPLLTNTYQAPATFNVDSVKYDSSKTGYQAPKVDPWKNIDLADVEYKAPADREVNSDTDTVAGQMSSLLDENSAYMQGAKAAGLQTAASRGLLNTSMAGKASQAAAIEAALPIAEQDAGFYQNRYLANQQGDINSALSTQEYKQQGGLYNLQSEASSRLSAQDAAQQGALNQQQGYISAALAAYQGAIQAGLSSQEASQQAALAAFQGAIESGLSRQEAMQAADLAAQKAAQDYKLTMDQEQIQQGGANFRQQMEISSNEKINMMQMGSEEKRQISVQISNLGQTFMQQLAAVQTNPDLTPEAKAEIIAGFQSQYKSDVNSLLALYGIDVTWDYADLGDGGDSGGDDGGDTGGSDTGSGSTSGSGSTGTTQDGEAGNY